MTAINIITGLVLIAIGIVVKHAKMHNLIAGYNTMTPEQKSNFDIDGFATFFRNCFALMGLVIIIGHFLFDWLEFEVGKYFIITIGIVGGLPFLLIMSKKFYKNRGNE